MHRRLPRGPVRRGEDALQQCRQPLPTAPLWALWPPRLGFPWLLCPEPHFLPSCACMTLCWPLPLLRTPPPCWSHRATHLSTSPGTCPNPLVLSRTMGPFAEQDLSPLGARNLQIRALTLWDLLFIWNELKPGFPWALFCPLGSREPACPLLSRAEGWAGIMSLLCANLEGK